MKICSKCKISKEYSEYAKDNSRTDGYSYVCKTCKKSKYNENRDSILLEKAEYYQLNRDKLIQKACAYGVEWRKRNKDKVNYYNSKKRIRKLNRSCDVDPRIKMMYGLAKRLSNCLQVPFHVDHVVPLQGQLVSGLHVFDNLQVITAKQNYKKNNKFSG